MQPVGTDHEIEAALTSPSQSNPDLVGAFIERNNLVIEDDLRGVADRPVQQM